MSYNKVPKKGQFSKGFIHKSLKKQMPNKHLILFGIHTSGLNGNRTHI